MRFTVGIVGVLAALTLILVHLGHSQDPIKKGFLQFIMDYNKHYSPSQLTFRYLKFVRSTQQVNSHNQQSKETYTKGINQFADMDDQEFERLVLMSPRKIQMQDIQLPQRQYQVNASVDWRTKGAVSPVKNQGSCGSCWAFSTIASIQSLRQIKKGIMYEYSVQQLLDCCDRYTYACFGCSGGWPDVGMQFIRDNGVNYMSSYPYTGVPSYCKATTGNRVLGQTPYRLLNQRDLDEFRSQVNAHPVSVCVSSSNWRQYKSGVFNGCAKGDTLDHCVLLVGYQQSGNWIIKNSFGQTWGESGYIRLAPGNTCGMGSYGLVPILI